MLSTHWHRRRCHLQSAPFEENLCGQIWKVWDLFFSNDCITRMKWLNNSVTNANARMQAVSNWQLVEIRTNSTSLLFNDSFWSNFQSDFSELSVEPLDFAHWNTSFEVHPSKFEYSPNTLSVMFEVRPLILLLCMRYEVSMIDCADILWRSTSSWNIFLPGYQLDESHS